MIDSSISVPKPAPVPALLDVAGVAALLGCSKPHVRRLADARRMPAPLRVGALVRWRAGDIQEWIAAGCPRVSR
ncbi:MAG: excisionase family DNA-binding protein [Phycisphaerales bacterium]|nr:excisionase family DNA-binding protein [Phycisphaerales bacterium]